MVGLSEMGQRAKAAARELARLDVGVRNDILKSCAKALRENSSYILEENEKDLEAAAGIGLKSAFMERLTLNVERIEGMANGMIDVAALPDPLNRFDFMQTMHNGLMVGKKRVPLGVLGFIFESRPNVSADAAALCIKSGNAVILRGGKESLRSNIASVEIIRKTLEGKGHNPDFVQIITDTSRETALEMMRLNEYIDVLIPRGGAGLKKSVMENSNIPVIETGMGNCHIYIDEHADLEMAMRIVINAKTQRPSVCNACETMLVHSSVAERFLPMVCDALKVKECEIRGDETVRKIVPWIGQAADEDWATEYGELIIAVKVVSGLDEAVRHIEEYSTNHSEAIVTENYNNAMYFLDEVDAAAVYVNASTRFTDGGEFGLGAEIGISTQKLHARGPMGLNELTTTKFVVFGSGQVR